MPATQRAGSAQCSGAIHIGTPPLRMQAARLRTKPAFQPPCSLTRRAPKEQPEVLERLSQEEALHGVILDRRRQPHVLQPRIPRLRLQPSSARGKRAQSGALAGRQCCSWAVASGRLPGLVGPQQMGRSGQASRRAPTLAGPRAVRASRTGCGMPRHATCTAIVSCVAAPCSAARRLGTPPSPKCGTASRA